MNIKLKEASEYSIEDIKQGNIYRNKGSGLICFAVYVRGAIYEVGLRSMANGALINIQSPNSWENVTHLFTLVEN